MMINPITSVKGFCRLVMKKAIATPNRVDFTAAIPAHCAKLFNVALKSSLTNPYRTFRRYTTPVIIPKLELNVTARIIAI